MFSLFDRMTEKRFERLEAAKTCSDNKQEDVKSMKECKEAAHELGYSFRGQTNWTTTNTVNISKACLTVHNQYIVAWVQYRVEDWESLLNDYHVICRKTGKCILQYCIALY